MFSPKHIYIAAEADAERSEGCIGANAFIEDVDLCNSVVGQDIYLVTSPCSECINCMNDLLPFLKKAPRNI